MKRFLSFSICMLLVSTFIWGQAGDEWRKYSVRVIPVRAQDNGPYTTQWMMSPSAAVIRSGENPIDRVVASDPSAIVLDNVYYLYYTCAGVTPDQPDEVFTRICLATSADGITFERHPGNPVLESGPAGAWDGYQVETAFAFQHDDEIWLYYMGYDGDNGEAWINGENITLGSIGLAVSPDGVHFERIGPDPVLTPTPGEP